MSREKLFRSFFLGGFECSTHRLRSGKRLDEIAFTEHDRFARADYLRLHEQGIRSARDGLRWHLIEATPKQYDFSSLIPLMRAARETGTQVTWDLFHYGSPDWLDIFEPEFVDSFANLARAFARLWQEESDEVLYVCPINEISFFSWAGGQVGIFNPFRHRRGNKLKEQLVRASIAGIEAMWDVDSRTRIMAIDPMINVLPNDPTSAAERRMAESYRRSQFDAWDMLAGRRKPELGGAEKYLDVIGGNFYVHNQWIHGGSFVPPSHPRYRPYRKMLEELYQRYQRPLFVAETGIEDEARPSWLRYVCEEVRAARRSSVPVEGICLYPIVNHPGWDDDRHCHNGLWDYPNEQGDREIYQPLAAELQRQRQQFESDSGLDSLDSPVQSGRGQTEASPPPIPDH